MCYDRIVSFEPYEDGLGIMRDAQTAKPQSFRTGAGFATLGRFALLLPSPLLEQARVIRLQPDHQPGPDVGKELASDLSDRPGQGPLKKQ